MAESSRPGVRLSKQGRKIPLGNPTVTPESPPTSRHLSSPAEADCASDLERLIERFELRRSPSRLAVDSMGSVPAGLCCGSRAAETCETLVATGYQQYRSHGKTEAAPGVLSSAIIADLRRDGCISSEESREYHAVNLQQELSGALHASLLERVSVHFSCHVA